MNKQEQKAFKKIMNDCNCPNCQYKKAYNILMEYFDSISDEEKPRVDKQLKKLGL